MMIACNGEFPGQASNIFSISSIKLQMWEPWHVHCLEKKSGKRRGLTLGCGPMAGEYPMLKSFGVDSIEAYDTAEGMYQKFLEFQPNPEIPATYHVMDVNEIHLEEGAFDAIYIQHAYHHFERIEHVAEEISKVLKPSGVFVITDWIGPNFLQRTPQLAVMNNLWHHMPAKWRTDRMDRSFRACAACQGILARRSKTCWTRALRRCNAFMRAFCTLCLKAGAG
ncbi:unnamed protein product [Effrenium voratum]|uniref:Methyltransferase type 11 domain-containing protein n=1 Tax=Effrenium voratum TaxID=2562239 RepID=A0AA36I248_9DINO|nr:unnamed protein product [Effrenium voratum]